jgi:hypothetical protein
MRLARFVLSTTLFAAPVLAVEGPSAALPAQAAACPFPAPERPAPPQIRSAGEPVLTAPRVVPLLFAGDPLAGQIGDFASKLGPSAYWAAVTAEYGVGAATATPPVVLNEVPPPAMTSDDVAAWLGAKLGAPGGALPAPDDETVYVVFYPATSLTQIGPFGSSIVTCPGPGALHDPLPLPSGATPKFVAVSRCASDPSLQGIDAVTAAATAALVATVTNPQTTSPLSFGYVDPDFDGSAWNEVTGAVIPELPTFCAIQPHSSFKDAALGYTVPRSWSNASAQAGHDPCVPAPEGPYFVAAPVLHGGTETWSPLAPTATIYTLGVSLAPGESKTIELRLYSDAPTAEWTLSASELPSSAGDPNGLLRFAFDEPRGRNGDVRRLTVSLAEAPDGGGVGSYTSASFAITSTLGADENVWWVGTGH